jgi:hypothetical protein
MTSLSDIPDNLKNADKKDAFVEWVLELAVDFNVTRSLIHLWTKLTRTRLTSEEWLKIETAKKAQSNV